MSEENKQTKGVILGAITWGAFILILLMILVYKDCQSTQDNIQSCIKAGKDPKACACSFTLSYRACRGD